MSKPVSAKIAQRQAWWADQSADPMTAARGMDYELRSVAKAVATNLVRFRELIERAKAENPVAGGQLWDLLGFKSWTAYIADVVGKEMRVLSVDDRRQIVAVLDDEGMSQRAIAATIGVSNATVSRDIGVLHDVTVDGGDLRSTLASAPKPGSRPPVAPEDPKARAERERAIIEKRVSLDGKSRPAHPKPKPTPPPFTPEQRATVIADFDHWQDGWRPGPDGKLQPKLPRKTLPRTDAMRATAAALDSIEGALTKLEEALPALLEIGQGGPVTLKQRLDKIGDRLLAVEDLADKFGAEDR